MPKTITIYREDRKSIKLLGGMGKMYKHFPLDTISKGRGRMRRNQEEAGILSRMGHEVNKARIEQLNTTIANQQKGITTLKQQMQSIRARYEIQQLKRKPIK